MLCGVEFCCNVSLCDGLCLMCCRALCRIHVCCVVLCCDGVSCDDLCCVVWCCDMSFLLCLVL